MLKKSTSSLSSTPVDDMFVRLEGIGVCNNKLKQYKKNLMFAFSDGHLVADVLYAMVPNMIDIKSFIEEGSIAARRSNWERINRILSSPRVQMKLSREDIDAIVNRHIQKEMVLTFMTILIDKVDTVRNTMGENISSTTTTNNTNNTSTTNKKNDDSYNNSNNNNSSTSMNPVGTASRVGGSVRASIAPLAPGLSVKSKHLLSELERKKEISRRTSMMTSQQLDEMYSRTVKIAREESSKRTAMIDEMQKRSETINSEFQNLKVKNEEELFKVGKRLSLLELEVKAIEEDRAYMTSHVPNEDTSLFTSDARSYSIFGFPSEGLDGEG